MEHLLLVAPNWLGDTLFATAVIRAIKSREPQLHLAVLCVPRAAEMLRGNPRINELIVYDEWGRDRSWPAKWRLAQRLRRRAFDAALLLRPSLSRALILWWARIPQRIGHARGKSRWLLTHRVPLPSEPLHRAEGYLRLLTALGWPLPVDTSCEFFVREADRIWARGWLEAHGVTPHRPLVILHPAGNWAHKRWPVERFAALGDRLQEAHGVQLLITGGTADQRVAEEVRLAMRTPALVAAGETTVHQLGVLIERADLLVVNDSGPLHIAAALTRPFVALFGPTSPALTGPYHATSGRVLHHPGCCPKIPCYSPDRPPHRGMLSLTIDEVFESSQQLLQQGATVRHG